MTGQASGMTRFPAVVRLVTDTADVWVSCAWEYDPADPWAVTLVLWPGSPDPVTWVFARDLLTDARRWGVANPGGAVTVTRLEPDVVTGALWMRIDLVNPLERRHAVVLVRLRVVDAFLAETYRRVPPGTEKADWDAAMRAWTTGSAR